MSPYLFILCTEALIANIRKEERGKRFTRLKIARGSPPISHLLFVDDSLFICNATPEECGVILQLLKDYETVSGQQTNFEKSSKVPDNLRSVIHNILGITNLGGIGNYLGIPESLGGSKIQNFGYLNDRVNNKVNGWTIRFLTRGGEEVLIKSVASPMTTHVMSCFRLPKGVTKKITSIISHFWWDGGGNKNGIHWLSWDKVCTCKEDGGLSFRDLQDFNTTLLAKLFWLLIDKPECLFSKVFKGRYFQNTDPLENHRSYSSSYGWRSICSARSLVKKWLIKRVGTSIYLCMDRSVDPRYSPEISITKKSYSIFKPFFKGGTSY